LVMQASNQAGHRASDAIGRCGSIAFCQNRLRHAAKFMSVSPVGLACA
jgi:hypothetical protein